MLKIKIIIFTSPEHTHTAWSQSGAQRPMNHQIGSIANCTDKFLRKIDTDKAKEYTPMNCIPMSGPNLSHTYGPLSLFSKWNNTADDSVSIFDICTATRLFRVSLLLEMV